MPTRQGQSKTAEFKQLERTLCQTIVQDKSKGTRSKKKTSGDKGDASETFQVPKDACKIIFSSDAVWEKWNEFWDAYADKKLPDASGRFPPVDTTICDISIT